MEMFTLDDIKTAHSKVKSGADFPAYIKELKALGVFQYETFVADGHVNYCGTGNYRISSPAKYSPLLIPGNCIVEQFRTGLKEHQQGKTDYMSFIVLCAGSGVEKWIVDIEQMTCTYFDRGGNEILLEQIPQA